MNEEDIPYNIGAYSICVCLFCMYRIICSAITTAANQITSTQYLKKTELYHSWYVNGCVFFERVFLTLQLKVF